MTFPFPFFPSVRMWLPAASVALNANRAGLSGYTNRVLLPAGAVRNGTKIRITCSPPSTGNNTVIGACYIGHKGVSAPDFDGGQVQVLFGGLGTRTLTVGGGDVISDEITFAYDKSKELIVSMYFSTTSDIRERTGLGATYNTYQKNSSDAASTSTSGYTGNSGFVQTVGLVEVYG